MAAAAAVVPRLLLACGCPWGRHGACALHAQVSRGGVVLQLAQPVRRGDGLVFDAGRPQDAEQGGQVYDVADPASGASLEGGAAGATVALQFGRGQVDLSAVAPGDLVWKNKGAWARRGAAAAARGLPLGSSSTCGSRRQCGG